MKRNRVVNKTIQPEIKAGSEEKNRAITEQIGELLQGYEWPEIPDLDRDPPELPAEMYENLKEIGSLMDSDPFYFNPEGRKIAEDLKKQIRQLGAREKQQAETIQKLEREIERLKAGK